MALAILMEQLHFVSAGVGQNCGCETAQGEQHWDDALWLWCCV